MLLRTSTPLEVGTVFSEESYRAARAALAQNSSQKCCNSQGHKGKSFKSIATHISSKYAAGAGHEHNRI